MSIAMPAVDQSTPNWTSPNGHNAQPAANGRWRADELSDTERNFAVAIHLSPLASFIFPLAYFAPLVLWLIRKDHSAFNDDHGRESVNFLISFIVLNIALVLGMFTVIGIPVALVGIPTIWIVGVISVIRGAIAAGHGEYFRYPLTIRFIG